MLVQLVLRGGVDKGECRTQEPNIEPPGGVSTNYLCWCSLDHKRLTREDYFQTLITAKCKTNQRKGRQFEPIMKKLEV